MSSLTVTCEHCGEVYWFAMVGSTFYGGHVCPVLTKPGAKAPPKPKPDAGPGAGGR